MFFAQVVLLLYTCGIASSKSEVVLTPKGSFKIAIFSDLHYGENEDSFGIVQDERSATLMTDVLAQEQPNLSVLLGDLITGENTFAFNSSEYLDKIVEPLVEGGYGWASVYGNHDSKYNLTRRALLRAELKYQNSHTQGGPPGTDGISNYMIPLYDSSGTTDRSTQKNLADEDFGNAPLGLLYFLDSRGGSEGDPSNNDNVPNFVSARTAAWLYETSQVAREQWGVLPSLAFVHIPIQAFLDSQKNAQFDIGGSHFPGLNADAPLARQGDGCVGRDRCSYEGQDIPFMQALLQIEGLHSVYSGHEYVMMADLCLALGTRYTNVYDQSWR